MTLARSILDVSASDIEPSTAFAAWADAHDPLAALRSRFEIPKDASGREMAYLVGNSLGLMPKAARTRVQEELDDWARLGAEGHVHGRRPWIDYHQHFRSGLSLLTGGLPSEVVAMNTLTVNLHLLLMSFLPTSRMRSARRKVLIERGAFPSDRFAVRSFVAATGGDADTDVIEVGPRDGESCLRLEDIERAIADVGDSLALVMLGGVQYYTGQVLDMPRITRAAHAVGALCGWDLAHAVGNVPLALHDWGVDFACWCSYKYLNGGPGAVAGAFVHERHHANPPPRLEGWWGTDPATRFAMGPDFAPGPGADAWQLSNPPVLSLAPLLASFELFAEAGMERLAAKARVMTAFLEMALRVRESDLRIITPSATGQRGCQLSIEVQGSTAQARARFDRLLPKGVVCDFRHPRVIRAAPAPLYCSFGDCWRLIEALHT